MLWNIPIAASKWLTSPRKSDMGAPHVSPEEIVEMQRLYRIYGTYAEVSRRLTRYRSPSSVSNYVQMKKVPRNIRIAVENLSQQTA